MVCSRRGIQAARDAEKAAADRKRDEEKRLAEAGARQAEARAKRDQELNAIEETLAHLGFALERSTHISGSYAPPATSMPTMESCALQCLKTSSCEAFSYENGKCFQAGQGLRRSSDPTGKGISGHRLDLPASRRND
jgi:PAN-like domain-containing protein